MARTGAAGTPVIAVSIRKHTSAGSARRRKGLKARNRWGRVSVRGETRHQAANQVQQDR